MAQVLSNNAVMRGAAGQAPSAVSNVDKPHGDVRRHGAELGQAAFCPQPAAPQVELLHGQHKVDQVRAFLEESPRNKHSSEDMWQQALFHCDNCCFSPGKQLRHRVQDCSTPAQVSHQIGRSNHIQQTHRHCRSVRERIFASFGELGPAHCKDIVELLDVRQHPNTAKLSSLFFEETC